MDNADGFYYSWSGHESMTSTVVSRVPGGGWYVRHVVSLGTTVVISATFVPDPGRRADPDNFAMVNEKRLKT